MLVGNIFKFLTSNKSSNTVEKKDWKQEDNVVNQIDSNCFEKLISGSVSYFFERFWCC